MVITSVAAHAGADSVDFGSWVTYGSGDVRTVVRYDDSMDLCGYGFELTDQGIGTPGTSAVNLAFDAARIPIDHVSINFKPAENPGGPGNIYWARHTLTFISLR
jgi:hypothetical protein|tara:strand:+ start:393 stop:704 length:312 start_codon:yes stop_codon:yes gene_type:complete